MPRSYLTLYGIAFGLLALAPVGVAAGLWLALGAGYGLAAGSGAYACVAVLLLLADVLPNPEPREVER